VPQPKLACFIWVRQMKLKAVAEAIGCSHEQVRLMTLPFDNPRRRVPGAELMARIVAWTGGEITPADFYPPHLNGVEKTPAEAHP
jgi:hypothetical protein